MTSEPSWHISGDSEDWIASGWRQVSWAAINHSFRTYSITTPSKREAGDLFAAIDLLQLGESPDDALLASLSYGWEFDSDNGRRVEKIDGVRLLGQFESATIKSMVLSGLDWAADAAFERFELNSKQLLHPPADRSFGGNVVVSDGDGLFLGQVAGYGEFDLFDNGPVRSAVRLRIGSVDSLLPIRLAAGDEISEVFPLGSSTRVEIQLEDAPEAGSLVVRASTRTASVEGSVFAKQNTASFSEAEASRFGIRPDAKVRFHRNGEVEVRLVPTSSDEDGAWTVEISSASDKLTIRAERKERFVRGAGWWRDPSIPTKIRVSRINQ